MKKTLLILVIAICNFNCFAQLPWWVPSTGLLVWYPFHGNANDESGNNNNGTVNSAVLTTNRFGTTNDAYAFNGSNSSISVSSSASLESPTTRLSMCAWVNMAGVSSVGGPYNPVLSKTNSINDAFMYSFAISPDLPSSFKAGTNNWSTYAESPSCNLSLNQWYMLAIVLDSSTASFYINDSLIGTNLFTTNIVNDTLPLTIGNDPPFSNEVFNGIIDDIGVWNRALTQQEIINLYTGPVGIAEIENSSAFYIYPNPTKNNLQINFATVMNEAKIEICNVVGKNIYQENKFNGISKEINLKNISAGIYFIKVSDNEKCYFKKLIVE